MGRKNFQVLKTRFLFACAFQCVALLFVFGMLFFLNPDISWGERLERFQNWDAHHYLSLAEFGYQTTGDEANFIVFFPVYPMLVRAFSFFGISFLLAGILASSISMIFGIFFFLLYLESIGYSFQRSIRIVVLFALSPIAVFFSLVYTEALFFFETSLFLYALSQKKWVLAACVGAVASGTRIMGVLFVIPYLFSILEQRMSRSTTIKKLLAGVLIPFGYFCYLGMNWFYFSNPFQYREVLQSNWHKTVANPLLQVIGYSKNIFNLASYEGAYTSFIDHVSTIVLSMCIVGIAGYWIFKKRMLIHWGMLFWVVAQWVVIASQSFWLSNARYIGLILPLFLWIEHLVKKNEGYYAVILMIFSSLYIYGVLLFAKGEWLY